MSQTEPLMTIPVNKPAIETTGSCQVDAETKQGSNTLLTNAITKFTNLSSNTLSLMAEYASCSFELSNSTNEFLQASKDAIVTISTSSSSSSSLESIKPTADIVLSYYNFLKLYSI